jgi:hypothetical protein
VPKPGKKTGAPKAPKPTAVERKIIYPETTAVVRQGADAVTVPLARELLGWTTDPNAAAEHGVKYPLLEHPVTGEKVYALNNTRNRKFIPSWAEALAQELLHRRWAGPNGNGKRINGEPLVIGETGETLSAQHRLVALEIAEARRTSEKEKGHWAGYWDRPVVMDTLVVFGADESDEVVNTLDTGRARTPADMLYRCDLLLGYPPDERHALSKMLDSAVRLLWHRTAMDVDAYGPRRTHAEIYDFIVRHPRLIQAARHVNQEYGDGERRASCGKVLRPGAATGLLYLMAASASDGGAYRAAVPRSEKTLDLTRWDRAKEFWVELLKSTPAFKEVRLALGAVVADPDDDGALLAAGKADRNKTAVLVKAWGVFVEGRPFRRPPSGDDAALSPDLALTFEMDKYQNRVLVDNPVLGGIDLGNVVEKEAPPEPPAAGGTPPPKKTKKSKVNQDADDKAAAGKQDLEKFNALKAEHGDAVLLFKSPGDKYRVNNEDAKLCAKVCGLVPARDPASGMLFAVFGLDKLDAVLDKLQGRGHVVACCTWDDEAKKVVVVPYDAPPAAAEPAPAPAPNGKAKAKGPGKKPAAKK